MRFFDKCKTFSGLKVHNLLLFEAIRVATDDHFMLKVNPYRLTTNIIFEHSIVSPI